MTISLTFTGETPDCIHSQLRAWLAGTGAPVPAVEPEAAQAQEPEPEASDLAPIPETTPEPTPAVVPKVESEVPPQADDAQPVAAPDYADVRERVLKLAVAKGPEFVRDLLSGYGVAKASDLEPSRWPALMASIDAAMG